MPRRSVGQSPGGHVKPPDEQRHELTRRGIGLDQVVHLAEHHAQAGIPLQQRAQESASHGHDQGRSDPMSRDIPTGEIEPTLTQVMFALDRKIIDVITTSRFAGIRESGDIDPGDGRGRWNKFVLDLVGDLQGLMELGGGDRLRK